MLVLTSSLLLSGDMTEAQGSSKETQLTVDEKKIIAHRMVETDSNYGEPLPVTLEEAKRSSLCLSEFVGDKVALLSEEGYRTLLQIVELLHQRC